MDIKYKKIKKGLDWETGVTLMVVFACMWLFAFFPIKMSYFQGVALSLVFLFLVPYFYIKIILKKKLSEFGFQLVKWKEGFLIMPVCFLIMAGVFYVVFQYTDFREQYFLREYSMVNSFWYLFVYEFLVINLYVLLYEAFFRGFVMFYFKNKLDIYSIFAQLIIFIIFFFILQRLSLDYIFYLTSAFLAGLIAYRSKSLAYSYLFSIIVLIAGDIIYLKLTK